MPAIVVPVPGRVTTAPGDIVGLLVRVSNIGTRDSGYQIRLIGLDPDWWSGPVEVPLLAAGDTIDVELSITLPLGFPSGTQLLGIEATPIAAPKGGRGRGDQPVRATVELEVSARREVFCDLEPDAVSGGFSAAFQVVIGNRSPFPTRIRLTGEGPEGELRFHFDPAEPELAPGQRLVVPARVRGNRPSFGEEARRPFMITAHGPGEPVRAAGTFMQAPWVSAGLVKVLAIVTLFALWATMLWAGLGRINDNKNDEADSRQASDAAVAVDDPTAGGAGGADGAGGAGGGGAADGESAAGPEGPLPFELTGVVSSEEPGGVNVLLRPVSLAEGLGRQNTAAPQGRRSKLFGPFPALPTQQSGERFTRTDDTDTNGEFGFAGLEGPGFYEVRFSKPGYKTVSHIVEATEDGTPVELEVTLVAGDGALGGLISDANGPLGGVDVTVSDGDVTYSTRTPTTGDGIGRWSIQGLDTPAVWLVTLSRRGFSTETALVTLPAGGSDEAVNVAMIAGVGSVSGSVVGPGPAGVEPKGGLTVTATDGTITRTTSTLTEGDVGTYLLPQLPVPGVYTITLQGDGFLPLTSSVELTLDDANATGIDFALIRTTGRISGEIIEVELVDHDSDPTTPDQPVPVLVDSDGDGFPDEPNVIQTINSVGITATDGNATFKTTSAEDGVFTLDGLPPGTYVITFDRFGFASATATVSLVAGDDILVDDDGVVGLIAIPESPVSPSGVVTGTVTNALNPREFLRDVPVMLKDVFCDNPDTEVREDLDIDDHPNGVEEPAPCQAITDENGAFTIVGVPTGAFTITFGLCVDNPNTVPPTVCPPPEFVGHEAIVKVPPTTPVTVNAVLVPFGVAFGTIRANIDLTGNPEPLTGVEISIFNQLTGEQVLPRVDEDGDGRFETAADGTFDTGRVFGPRAPGDDRFRFVFDRAGVVQRTLTNVTIRPGDRVNVSQTLFRAPQVLGTVLDGVPPSDPNVGGLDLPRNPTPTGLAPFVGATVQLTGASIGLTRTATSDDLGFYSFYLCDETTGDALVEGVPTDGSLPPAGAVNCLPTAGGTYTVTASNTGYNPEAITLAVAADQARLVNFALFTTPNPTTGFVYWLDGTTRVPIGGASVRAEGVTDVSFNPNTFAFNLTRVTYTVLTTTDNPATTTVNEAGRFTIPASGTVNPLFFTGPALVDHPDFQSGQSAGALTAGNCNGATPPAPDCNQIALVPEPGSLTGFVVIQPADADPFDGTDLDQLQVTVKDGTTFEVVTNAQIAIIPIFGQSQVQVFINGLLPRTYDIEFTLPAALGYEGIVVRRQVLPNRTIDFGNQPLRKFASLTVTAAQNGAGNPPLPGATVTVTAPTITSTLSASGGAGIALNGIRYRAQVTPTPPEGTTIQLVPTGITATTDATGAATFSTALAGSGAYRPTVLTPAGGTVTGSVAFTPVIPPAVTGAATGDPPASTAQITGLAANITYTVAVTKDGYFTPATQTFTPVPGQAGSLGFALDRASTVSGTIKDPAGANISGATVTVTPDVGDEPVVGTGTYTIANLPAGTITITASKAGYRSDSETITLTLNEDRTGVNLVLVPLVDPRVTVVGYTADDSDGDATAAVEGATVTLNPGNITATTGDEGVANFDPVPWGTYTLTVTGATGFLDHTQSIELETTAFTEPPMIQDVSVTLERPKTISGRVTTAGAGNTGVNGVTIRLELDGNEVATTTTSGSGANDSGSYSFTGLRSAAQPYIVTVVPPLPDGYEGSVVTPDEYSGTITPSGGGFIFDDFTIIVPLVEPRVTVVGFTADDSDGDATAVVEGATVTLDPGELTATTDDEGVATFAPVSWGEYTLTVTAAGFGTHTETIQLEAAAPTDPPTVQDVAVTLERPGAISGRVTTAGTGSTGVNGATIRLELDGNEVATTTTAGSDATTGSYSFTGLASAAQPYTVTVSALPDGYEGSVVTPTSHSQTITPSGGAFTFDFSVIVPLVEPRVTVDGYTADPDDGVTVAVVEGATVTLDPGEHTATTDDEGVATFAPVGWGEYTLTVEADGFRTHTQTIQLEAAEPTDPPTVQDVAVTLERPRTISGRVSTDTDTGLNDASVQLKLGEVEIGTTTTSGNGANSGEYTFTGLGSGDYTVTVTAVPTGYELPAAQTGTITPSGGGLTFDFTVEPTPPPEPAPGALEGMVTTASGDGLGGVTVTAESLAGDLVQTSTASDGTFAFGDLDPSVWELDYTAAGYSPLIIREEVRSGQATTTDVALSAYGNAVTGTVTGRNANDAASVPIDGAHVTLLDESGAVAGGAQTAGGGYSFEHLDDGSYTLLFDHDGFEPFQQTIQLDGRDRAVVDAALVARNGRLTVSVRDQDGRPVGGADVRLTSTQLEGGRTAVTGGDGTAVFDALPPASDYVVDVGRGRATAGPLSVAPGQVDASVTLTVAAPGAVTGVVTLDGVPANGIELALFAAAGSEPLASTFSGGDGRPGGFRFDDLVAGDSYRIVVFGEGDTVRTERTLTVAAGETTALDIPLTSPPPPPTSSTTTSTTAPPPPTTTTVPG